MKSKYMSGSSKKNGSVRKATGICPAAVSLQDNEKAVKLKINLSETKESEVLLSVKDFN